MVYYNDSELNSLGGIDACVKDSLDKNKFPKDGIFFKEYVAGIHYLAIGYRYINGKYGTVILHGFGNNNDKRYTINNGIFSKNS